MSETVTWEKPSKTKIETNASEATVAYCKSLGWKEKGRQSAPEAEAKEQPEGG